jgi:hypothetical protein
VAPPKAPATIPVIDGLQGKIGVIERRLDYLKRRLERPEYAASSSADFDKSEVSALEAAVSALRYVDRVRPSVCG